MTPTDPPKIDLAGLQIWIHGRQFPDAQDACDGNWLQITARCAGDRSSVEASGPLISVSDLVDWRRAVHAISQGEGAEATLDPLEPELKARIGVLDALGHLTLEVELTPDTQRESHAYRFDIDQSYLPQLLAELDAAISTYPPRLA